MKWFNKFLVLASVVCLLAGCNKIVGDDDDIIWDFTCYSVSIYLADSRTGQNLLDPANDGNVLGQEISVEYDGKSYPIIADSRFNMPGELALRHVEYEWQWNEANHRYEQITSHHLEFGEFTPCDDFHGEEFTIHWSDGTSNKVRFDCYIVWKSKKEPEVIRKLWLDGIEQEDWTCRITK